jgi:hypothetical protein
MMWDGTLEDIEDALVVGPSDDDDDEGGLLSIPRIQAAGRKASRLSSRRLQQQQPRSSSRSLRMRLSNTHSPTLMAVQVQCDINV